MHQEYYYSYEEQDWSELASHVGKDHNPSSAGID